MEKDEIFSYTEGVSSELYAPANSDIPYLLFRNECQKYRIRQIIRFLLFAFEMVVLSVGHFFIIAGKNLIISLTIGIKSNNMYM